MGGSTQNSNVEDIAASHRHGKSIKVTREPSQGLICLHRQRAKDVYRVLLSKTSTNRNCVSGVNRIVEPALNETFGLIESERLHGAHVSIRRVLGQLRSWGSGQIRQHSE